MQNGLGGLKQIKMLDKTNVKTNTIFNAIKSVFGILYPLITFPYVSRVLMAENVGKINFGNSVVSYFSLIASLGVTTYAVRECSKVREEKKLLNKTASQILSINILSTLVAYLALAVTLMVARPLEHYRELICIQSSVIIFTTLGADWLNTAMEDFKFIAVRTMGMQLFSLILMFLFVKKSEDYLIYAIISVTASSGANIINIFYRRKFCKTQFTFHMKLKKHLLPILLLFSLVLSQTIYCNSDMTILGLARNDYEVGLYSTSVKIYNLVNTTIASVAWVVMPRLSAGFAKKDYHEINRLLKYSLNFIIVIGLPCLAGLNVITKPLIYVIAGNEYLGATNSLHILSVALLFSLIGGWIGNMMMLPAGRDKLCLLSSVISAIVNVVLNLVFIPKFGMNAAAATTALAELIGIFIKWRFIDKNIKIDGFKDIIKAPFVGAVEIVIIGLLVSRISFSHFVVVFITIILSIIAYVITLLSMKNEFTLSFIKPAWNRITGRRKIQ